MAKEIHETYDHKSQPVGLGILVTGVLDGGGSPLSAGLKFDWGPAPWKFQVLEWTLLADSAGSLTVDVWKAAFANYPPLVANTITGTEKLTLVAANKNQSSVLAGWTTVVNAGETLRFNVDYASAVTRVTLGLRGKIVL